MNLGVKKFLNNRFNPKRRVIHARGQHVSQEEVEQNPYLEKYMRTHTLCGFLFLNEAKSYRRLTVYSIEVNCELCKRIMRKHESI